MFIVFGDDHYVMVMTFRSTGADLETEIGEILDDFKRKVQLNCSEVLVVGKMACFYVEFH